MMQIRGLGDENEKDYIFPLPEYAPPSCWFNHDGSGHRGETLM